MYVSDSKYNVRQVPDRDWNIRSAPRVSATIRFSNEGGDTSTIVKLFDDAIHMKHFIAYMKRNKGWTSHEVLSEVEIEKTN